MRLHGQFDGYGEEKEGGRKETVERTPFMLASSPWLSRSGSERGRGSGPIVATAEQDIGEDPLR
eukprot:gene2232-1393_t